MIKFYLELSNGERTFRLQSNKKTWREISSRELQEEDFLTEDAYAIIRLQKRKWWKVGANSLPIEEEMKRQYSVKELRERLFYNVYAVREFMPISPSREQLVSVLHCGDDRADNSLILTIDGLFELRSCRFSLIDPFVAVKFGRFQISGGYLGPEPVKDKKYVDAIYRRALELWITHTITGETNLYGKDFAVKCQNPFHRLFK